MEPHWYKEAIIYEVHVKCFYDSSGDGIGDFKGLKEKLDYLQDLGVTAIWLLPFYPSPLRDDGYDIADYDNVHPNYGTLRDFREFLREAHKRKLKVITELVINHTSDQHPWFQKARKSTASKREREFYVWSDTPEKYKGTRVIFQDFESSNWAWDHEAAQYYWHRFYSHQPDLNYDNPAVHTAMLRKLSFWFKMGVDGMRLDAVPYLYEREGTQCENLPETHAFLKKLRRYLDDNFEEKMLLAEANQWPEDAAKYFGEGDECQMAFHFPVMPRLFMAIHLEDSLPIIEIVGQTPQIPESCQWAVFLRNHDELTLEMVTDEERDYMFRVYAYDPQARLNLGIRRRLAPLLKNDRRKIELMNSLLFSLNGTPVIYYGDEIGMGDNIYLGDRNGVRTPMQWSSDRNAGFSRANPQQLYLPPIIDPEYHYETVNVEAQLNNPHSLLLWTRQLISLRKRYKAFSYGSLNFINVENRKILIFLREYEQELIMVISNLSRFPQYVELDLKKYNGYTPIEVFSGESFPSIGELPYFLTLGPYGYYWFALTKQKEETTLEQQERQRERQIQEITLMGGVETLFHPRERRLLETLMRKYLIKRSWFRKLLPKIDRNKITITDHCLLSKKECIHLVMMQIVTHTGMVNHIPCYLTLYTGSQATEKLNSRQSAVVAYNKNPKHLDLIYDLEQDPAIQSLLLDFMNRQKKQKSEIGELKGIKILPFDETKLVKLISRLEEGLDPDVEMRLFLAQKTNFKSFIPLKGYLEYKGREKLPYALAEVVGAEMPERHAKHNFTEAAERFLQKTEALQDKIDPLTILPKTTLLPMAEGPIHPKIPELLQELPETARVLGETTADFHQAFLSDHTNPDFAPVKFTLFYQRSLYQNMRRKITEALSRIRKSGQCLEMLEHKEDLFKFMSPLTHYPFQIERMRYHGNFILENVYYTGKDFLITNFGGNPGLTYAERKYKQSPLRDVASMLLSITEAGYEAVEKMRVQGFIQERNLQTFKNWALLWGIWIGSSFFRAYIRRLGEKCPYLPTSKKEIDFIMGLFLLDRCVEAQADPKTHDFEPSCSLVHYWLPLYENYKL